MAEIPLQIGDSHHGSLGRRRRRRAHRDRQIAGRGGAYWVGAHDVG